MIKCIGIHIIKKNLDVTLQDIHLCGPLYPVTLPLPRHISLPLYQQGPVRAILSGDSPPGQRFRDGLCRLWFQGHNYGVF